MASQETFSASHSAERRASGYPRHRPGMCVFDAKEEMSLQFWTSVFISHDYHFGNSFEAQRVIMLRKGVTDSRAHL
jgi:hypothetical protein